MTISIPEYCMVVLIGASSAGKSTFAARHFKPSEIISSDACREVVSDDANDQEATGDAFELVHYIAAKRLERRKLVVIDATNVRPQDRAHLVQLARKYHAEPVAIILDPGPAVCTARHEARADRNFASVIVAEQSRALAKTLGRIKEEGFRKTIHLASETDIAAATIDRHAIKGDKRDERGPFDVIGDVHGCCDELVALLDKLGYGVTLSGDGESRRAETTAPAGRRVIFVGDLVDRGPNAPDVLRIAMAMTAAGHALCVPGNHDIKLLRWLNGRNVRLTHGLERTAEQLDAEPESFRPRIRDFLSSLPAHVWVEGGKLAVAHAGIRESMLGRNSSAVREFCLYGETSGETDEFGLPIRYNWAAEYSGETQIVYGHTPVPDAEWLNNTLCIDTGCCFGGKLTALRWPEGEIVSEPAHFEHAPAVRPFGHPPARAVEAADTTSADATAAAEAGSDEVPGPADRDDMLDLDAVTGKRVITTTVGPTVTIQAANAGVALEVMTRFAVAPSWLAYLPATVSPPPLPSASDRSTLTALEHPTFAFEAYRAHGVTDVVLQEIPQGTSAVVVVCQDASVAAERFGDGSGATGEIYSAIGLPLFADRAATEAHLQIVRADLTASGFWRRHQTKWAIFDTVLSPAVVDDRMCDRAVRHAHTAAAVEQLIDDTRDVLDRAQRRGLNTGTLSRRLQKRAANLDRYRAAAEAHYSEPARAADIANHPQTHVLQLVATDAHLTLAEPFAWQCTTLEEMIAADPVSLTPSASISVDLTDAASTRNAIAWWRERTAAGVVGAVVKPADTIVRTDKGLVPPAFKCRGPEYLRLIYGPDYDTPENLARIVDRDLELKRALGLREFALGHEALRRLLADEPLSRVHECVFALLAFEAEPIDPRL